MAAAVVGAAVLGAASATVMARRGGGISAFVRYIFYTYA